MNMNACNETKTYVGLDIGGAHLKIARILSDGSIASLRQIVCPLWRGIDQLAVAYRSAASSMSISDDTHIVTMTGELSDSFPNREQGAHSILSAIDHLLKRAFWVYASDRGIIDNRTITDLRTVASMNWRASAEWLMCRCREGILVDMGSTTTDLVPFKSGRLAVRGYDDADRMQHRELIYSGISRTPIMAIADHFMIDATSYPIMAEKFATTADVYRILEQLDEDVDLYPASDNAEKTVIASASRLERMFGLDWSGDLASTRIKASAIAELQQQKIGRALVALWEREQLADSACIIGAGAGYKIVRGIAKSLGLRFMPYHRLWDNLPNQLENSACYCATAVAVASLAWHNHL